jgi:Dolichyl-phosphate-mannose-protein mannosyltransferase
MILVTQWSGTNEPVKATACVPAQQRKTYLSLVLLGVALYLYLNLYALPVTPFLLSDDQVTLWMHGQQMLHGERIYQDFFQYTPPGTDLFYFAVFKILGARIWVTNMVVLGLGIALSLVCFHIGGQIMSRRMAALASALFVTVIYSRRLNATHHWFSVLLVMCGVAVVLERRNLSRILVAGLCLGLASFFTQTHGVVAAAAFSVFLIWERFVIKTSWRNLITQEGVLALSFGAAVGAVYSYYLVAVGLERLWYFQVTYVTKYLVSGPSSPLVGLASSSGWREAVLVCEVLLVCLLLAVIYPALLVASWRRRSSDSFTNERIRIALLGLVGLFLLLEVLSSPNWLRLYAVSMPGIILLVWWIGRARLRVYGLGLLCVGTGLLALGQIASRQFQRLTVGELRGGRVAASPPVYEKFRWVNEHTTAGEPFFQATWPGMYVPLDLWNPTFLDVADNPTPEYVQKAIRQLEAKRVRYVMWAPFLNDLNSNPIRTDHLRPMRAFLNQNYERIHVFGDQDEVWQRK